MGFTLLEVLVALVLLSMLAVLLTQSLQLAGASYTRSGAAQETTTDIRVTANLFGSTVDQFLPFVLPDAEPPVYAFVGGPDELAFVSVLPEGSNEAGPRWLRWNVVEANGAASLLFAYDGVPDDQASLLRPRLGVGDVTQPEVVVLVEGAAEIAFAYADRDVEGRLRGWIPFWSEADRLPAAIRLTITDPRSPWPEIIRLVPHDADLACAFPNLDATALCRLDAAL